MLFWGETCHWGCWLSRVSVVAGDFRRFRENAAVCSMSVSNIHVGHSSWNILNPASWHVTVDQFKHCSHGNSSLLLTVNPCQGCGYMVSYTCKTEHELEVCQINVPSAGSHFPRSMSNSLGVNLQLIQCTSTFDRCCDTPRTTIMPHFFQDTSANPPPASCGTRKCPRRSIQITVPHPNDARTCLHGSSKISKKNISNENRNMQNAQQEVYMYIYILCIFWIECSLN